MKSATLNGLVWMLPGVALMGFTVLLIGPIWQTSSAEAQRLAHARRVEIVRHMQRSLLSATDATERALIATTDSDAKTLADEAQRRSQRGDGGEGARTAHLKKDVGRRETELLGQFASDFSTLQHVEDELVTLAVMGPNRRAMAFAFGPAADVVERMRGALPHLREQTAHQPDAHAVAERAAYAEVAALHLLTLSPPHSPEAREERMNAMEVAMTADDHVVREALDALHDVPRLKTDENVAAAISSYEVFSDVRREILAFSHQNTNVCSTAMSLNENRKAVAACGTSLGVLAELISVESTGSSVRTRPDSPR